MLMGWWRRWRAVRKLERECDALYIRWQRAIYAYRDIGMIFRDQPEGFDELEAASRQIDDRYREYASVRDQLTRIRDTEG
jgi:hypothetical protein